MPYVEPTSRATGYLVTAANWNQDVVDNVTFLANPPACRVHNSAAQSIPNATQTAITFSAERYDTDSMHSTVTNTSRITVNTAGLYLFTGHAAFQNNGTGRRIIYVRINGSNYIAQNEAPPAGGDATLSIATVWAMAVGDYAEMPVYQNSGGALNVDRLTNQSAEFTATWIGLG